MDDKTLGKLIKSAYNDEMVPADLTERTVQRGKAILEGRAAEEKIQLGEREPGLFAKAAAGRLMLLEEMPESMQARELIEGLSKLPGCRAMEAESPEKQMQSLRNGSFLKVLAEKTPQKDAASEVLSRAASRDAPEKDPPQKQPLQRNIPGM